jgi:hypothetical protein
MQGCADLKTFIRIIGAHFNRSFAAHSMCATDATNNE